MGDFKNLVETVNPATEQKLDSYPCMSDAAVTEAIEACHDAHREWRKRSFSERAGVLCSIAGTLQQHKEPLARLMTDEMGKLLSQSFDEVDLCAAICEYAAEQAPEVLASQRRSLITGGTARVSFQPLGVVYGIQPWNYPAYQVVRYALASLAAGNGVLLKHASNVTGTGQQLQAIFNEAGLPDGLFRALVIGHEQSRAVIKHPLVRGVTLTGSAAAGREIGKQAGAALKKTVLELGSNDAYLVLEDADIDHAVKHAVQGRIYNNGETCIAAKRFIVTQPVYQCFRDAFVEAMDAVRLGDPTAEDSELGPMARSDLREKLHDQVQDSVEAGASVLCGGALPDRTGFYYPATVLEDVGPGQPAYTEELFGPVASLIVAKDRRDAMRIANDSRFGLGGGIFSADEDAAIALAEDHFDTGMVFINRFGLADPAMPFGGVKDSGYGREHGGFGLREFVNVKAVAT